MARTSTGMPVRMAAVALKVKSAPGSDGRFAVQIDVSQGRTAYDMRGA
jgi:hypothetical protein